MWKPVFVVLGAFVGGAVVWFVAWPGLALFGVQEFKAKDVRYAVPLGVLVFSLFGFWLGTALDSRARSNEHRQTWAAVFAVLGTVVGYVIGVLACWPALAVIGLKGDAVWMIQLFGAVVGGAVFCLLGFWLGSLRDRRMGYSDSPQEWTRVAAGLGAAVGPIIGYAAVYGLTFVSMGGDCWRRFGASAAGLFFGAPIGGILFCLLGFCLGSTLDERRSL